VKSFKSAICHTDKLLGVELSLYTHMSEKIAVLIGEAVEDKLDFVDEVVQSIYITKTIQVNRL
jgi:hypothetical protein